MELIATYFPNLTSQQLQQFEELEALYVDWNAKINVVSRKDIEHLYLHHILHSLAIAKFIDFKPGTKVVDLGTGGGFPGIPLAIFFPEVSFLLVDSINKKITVANAVIEALDLQNAKAITARVEELKGQKFDFVVTRAVATIDKLIAWSRKSIASKQLNALPNGIIALKGGNVKEELKLLPKGEYTEVVAINKYFKEPFFNEKCVLYLQG